MESDRSRRQGTSQVVRVPAALLQLICPSCGRRLQNPFLGAGMSIGNVVRCGCGTRVPAPTTFRVEDGWLLIPVSAAIAVKRSNSEAAETVERLVQASSKTTLEEAFRAVAEIKSLRPEWRTAAREVADWCGRFPRVSRAICLFLLYTLVSLDNGARQADPPLAPDQSGAMPPVQSPRALDPRIEIRLSPEQLRQIEEAISGAARLPD